MITAVGQIAVPVADLERATTFYRDVLGAQFLFSAPPGLAFFNVGGVRLMLDTPLAEKAGAATPVYFKVADIDAAFAHFDGKAEIVQPPHMIARLPDHDLWMGFIKDSEGNTLGIMEERR